MGVTLVKGGNISLNKEAPGLKEIFVGLGWRTRDTSGQDFDLDASAFLVTDRNKVRDDNDFVFYHNLTSTDGSVEHTGDNLTGGEGGDDEVIKINLDKIPSEIARFDLTEDMSTETSMIFGDIYRNKSEWKFKAVGQGFTGGLAAMCRYFGVDVQD
jgi:tellurium resistance protein TerD